MDSTVLSRAAWRARAAAHEDRVDAWVQPYLERRRRGVAHPVHDFLFTYYSHRPAALRRWHPGYGVTLLEAPEYADLKGYRASARLDRPPGGRAADATEGGPAPDATEGGPAADATEGGPAADATEGGPAPDATEGGPAPDATEGGPAADATEGGRAATKERSVETSVTAEHLTSQRPVVESIRRLLVATASRPATYGCFGLHEWAMAYRADAVRHPWPLRLGTAGTDTVVESHRVACSHFDAFRFFTEPARPLNALQPGRDDRADFEQPGCLHAGMDLYKHAFRLTPLVPSELVADCFALAWDIRELDMRASPYDLADLGYTPVRIETAEGKAEYVAAQRGFAERAAPLRRRIVAACDHLLAASPSPI